MPRFEQIQSRKQICDLFGLYWITRYSILPVGRNALISVWLSDCKQWANFEAPCDRYGNRLQCYPRRGDLSRGKHFLQKFSRAEMQWRSSIQDQYLHAVQQTPVSSFSFILNHFGYLAAHSNIFSISGIKNINTM